MRAEAPIAYRAFLASTWADDEIRRLREEVWTSSGGRTTDEGPVPGAVWVAELNEPGLNPASGYDELTIADACLDAIEASERFVLLDDGTYGTSLRRPTGSSASSFLELELFQAASLQKPITLVSIVGKADRSSPLARLLEGIAQGEADVRVARDMNEARQLILEATSVKKPFAALGARARSRVAWSLALDRHRDWKNRRLFEEPALLGGAPVGETTRVCDADIAEEYLDEADRQVGMNRVLSRTWIAMRAMMGEHFSHTTDPRFVSLWNRALVNWGRAAAWRGLHGHLLLGSLAAFGAQAAMGMRLGQAHYRRSEEGVHDTYGSLCSANYSVAGIMPRRKKRTFYERSAAYLEEGLRHRPQEDRSALLPLRGAIELRLLRPFAARDTFAEALALAEKSGNADHVGFLTTELGWAELCTGRPYLARRRIMQGMDMVADEINAGFRARMWRKSMYASIACLRIGEARDTASRIITEATATQSYDQIDRVVRLTAREAREN